MHIFANLEAGLPLTDLEGYGAIEYVHNGEYFIATCNGGDLYAALTNKGVLWASTNDAIDAALFQGQLELVHYFRLDSGVIYQVKADNLYETDSRFELRKQVFSNLLDWKLGSFGSPTTLPLFSNKDASPNAWERELSEYDEGTEARIAREEQYYDMSALDRCQWCGKFETVYPLTDGTLACFDCVESLEDEEPANTEEVN
jgi:hypothetical protein